MPRFPTHRFASPLRRSSRPRLRAALFTAVLATPSVAHATNLSVDVSPAQTVSISGRSPSLKSVLEDVCFRAGVDLVYFDANDRPFGGTYRNLPLRDFLERALRGESYLADVVTLPETGQEFVTSVRVLGDPVVASARRAKGGGRQKPWQVPPALLRTAFDSTATSEAEREAALAAMAARISGDPAQLQGFLATDSRLIAEALVRFDGVEVALRGLMESNTDPRVAGKIDDVIAALTTLRGEKRR